MSKSSLKRAPQRTAGTESDRHKLKKRKLAHDEDSTTHGNAGPQIPDHIHQPSSEANDVAVEEAFDQDNDLKKKRKNKKSKSREKSKPKWTISRQNGGRFLTLDPLFANGEKHLMLATKNAVQVNSATTSLLVRSLEPATESNVTSYSLSSVRPEILYVGSLSGDITKWEWTTGRLLGTFKGPSQLLAISPTPAEPTEDSSEFVYTISKTGGNGNTLSMVRVGPGAKVRTQNLFERERLSKDFYLSKDGKVVVLHAGRKLIFGAVHQLTKPNGEARNVTFRELTVSEEISSMDVHERPRSASANPHDAALDIVVGTKRGPLLVYDDVYGKILARERLKESSAQHELVPRRLHWHRAVVNSAKWSRDGNYIISGGNEPVLVIWQLDTLQKQFLPHLQAPISRITVSPAGTSYSVLLTNNTNIVLSTSELQPTASMSGLDLSAPSGQVKDTLAYRAKSIATMCSYRPDEILLAKSPMLQVYNTRTQQTISRQAVTRNIAMQTTISPEGKAIADPTISQLSISREGTWLATVDEWSQPQEDFVDAAYPRSANTSRQREVTLRFWMYNPTTKLWELDTKIDDAHKDRFDEILCDEEATRTSIIQLQANPAKLEFATIGKDGYLRVWSTVGRRRHGQPVKDTFNRQLRRWYCRYELQLTPEDVTIKGAALSFSEDGSAIAASVRTNEDNFVQLIDNIEGVPCSNQPAIDAAECYHLALMGRYLITFGVDLQVYDVISSKLMYRLAITTSKRCPDPARSGFLAKDSSSQTVAIAFAFDHKNNGRVPQTQVAVFKMESAQPLYQMVIDQNIITLLADEANGGYLLIDDDGVIRRIQSSARVLESGKMLVSEPEMKLGLGDMFGTARSSLNASVESSHEVVGDQEARSADQDGAVAESIGPHRQVDQTGFMPVSGLVENIASQLIGRQ